MSLYTFLKALHVIGAASWVGATILGQFQAARLRAAGDPRRWADFLDEQEWLGNRFFAPVAGLTALLGVAMVLVSSLSFLDLWITIGIVLFLGSSVIGGAFLTPESKRLRDMVSERGLEDPEVVQRMRRITLVTQADVAILVLLVADMVIKPGA